jgi:outer membrane protein OmpA-like peptidoglycan-associated protein
MKKTLSLSTLAAAALLSACATTQTPPPELVQARSVVRDAESQPQVLSYAPLELKKATDTLNKANALNAKGESLAEVESVAYVARREAETAMAIASAKRNQETIKTAEADRERARADARTVQAQRAQADAANARIDAQSARLQTSSAQQQAEAARIAAMDADARARAARDQTAAARQQTAAAQMAAEEAQRQAATLQAELTDMKAQQTDRGMLVTLGDVLFEFGRADVKAGAQASLRKLAAYLQEHPERRIMIEGFTDSVGSDGANMQLSQRRAESVAQALSSLGVSSDRITTRGYGEGYPIADNGSVTNRALNRRVEVYISDNDQPVRARG